MGVWTVFDVLIDNPGYVMIEGDYDDENANTKYGWQSDVRVVTKSGEVTEIGYYDSYGRVVLNNKEYEISENSDEQEGVMISDVTWNYIKNHKSYKDMNLYHMLTSYRNINTGPPFKYVGQQDVIITSDRDNYYGAVCVEDEWAFIDPSLPEGARNKERIESIVNNFMEYCNEINNLHDNEYLDNFIQNINDMMNIHKLEMDNIDKEIEELKCSGKSFKELKLRKTSSRQIYIKNMSDIHNKIHIANKLYKIINK